MQSIFAKSIILFTTILSSGSVYSHPGHINESVHSYPGFGILIFIACVIIIIKAIQNK